MNRKKSPQNGSQMLTRTETRPDFEAFVKAALEAGPVPKPKKKAKAKKRKAAK